MQSVPCNHCEAKGVVPCHQCSGQGYFAKAVIAKLQTVDAIEAANVRKNGQTLRVQAPSNSAQWRCHRGQKSTQRLLVSELAARQLNEIATRYLRTYEDTLRTSAEEYEATAARWTKGYLPPALGMIINAMAEVWNVYRIDLEWEANRETFWNRIKKKFGWSKPTRGLVAAIGADLQQITEGRIQQMVWSPTPVAPIGEVH